MELFVRDNFDVILGVLVDEEDFFGLCLINQHFLPENPFQNKTFIYAIDLALKTIRENINTKVSISEWIWYKISSKTFCLYPAKFLYGRINQLFYLYTIESDVTLPV